MALDVHGDTNMLYLGISGLLHIDTNGQFNQFLPISNEAE
jgi:hypothetical protein